MAKKANGKIREIKDGKILLELPMPVAEVLEGIPQVVKITGRVKRWRGGEVQRWAAASLLRAERKFKLVKGYREISRFVAVLEQKSIDKKEVATLEYTA